MKEPEAITCKYFIFNKRVPESGKGQIWRAELARVKKQYKEQDGLFEKIDRGRYD